MSIHTSRGGVLEAEGTVEIKFRRKDVEKCIKRLDPECKNLIEKISCPSLDAAAKASLERKLSERMDFLCPLYHSVAVMFADLHDTPGRMEEKGCITQVIEWSKAREFFYWRLRRRLLEHQVFTLSASLSPSLISRFDLPILYHFDLSLYLS